MDRPTQTMFNEGTENREQGLPVYYTCIIQRNNEKYRAVERINVAQHVFIPI